MALCKLNSGEVDISGRIGGVFFKEGPGGKHLHPLPRRIRHPPTNAQKARREAFLWLTWWLKTIYTDALAQAWSIWSTWHPKTNKKGGRYFMTWRQAFFHVNLNRIIHGLLPYAWPPPFWP